MHCSDRFAAQVETKRSPVLLGLDPMIDALPLHLRGDSLAGVRRFCHALMESCAPHICGIKIQLAYFEQFGSQGIALVEQIIQQARQLALLVVMDGKRGDIAPTAGAYARAYLHPDSSLAADALTVNPWLGPDSLQPFVVVANTHDRMLFVLVHTSNPDAAVFQQPVGDRLVATINQWNQSCPGNNGCGRVGAVIGATKSAQLDGWHHKLATSWLLTPGLGAQKGDPTPLAAQRRAGTQLLVPISRKIIYASEGKDFAEAAAQVAADYRARLF